MAPRCPGVALEQSRNTGRELICLESLLPLFSLWAPTLGADEQTLPIRQPVAPFGK